MPGRQSKENSPSSWLPSTLRNELERLTDARRWYLGHPDHFALGDPEERYDAILGPEVVGRAAKRAVVAFTDKQTAFLTDFCDVTLPRTMARTGRSCGKTFLSALGQAVLAWCLPTFTCTVSAGSQQQAGRNYRYWRAFAESPAMYAPFGTLLGEPKAQLTDFRNGGWLIVLAASERSVKGEHPMMTVLDEACATDPHIMELLEGQVSGSSPPWGGEQPLYRIMSTGDKTFHPFRDRWDVAEALGYTRHTWGQRDCPWITEAEILQAASEHDANWAAIHIEGRWGSATGAVFREKDVLAAAIPNLQADPYGLLEAAEGTPGVKAEGALGVDWAAVGFTVLVVVRRVDAEPAVRTIGFPEVPNWPMHYVVHCEGYKGRTIEFLVDRITAVAQANGVDIFPDSSHPFENTMLTTAAAKVGRRVTPIVSTGQVLTMTQMVRGLFERRQMLIPQTGGTEEWPLEGQVLLNQLLAYSWDESASKRGVERPMKGNDDYVDAHKYAVAGLARIRPSRVKVLR